MEKIFLPRNVNECLFHCIHQDDATELIDHALQSQKKLGIKSGIKSDDYKKDEYSFIVVKANEDLSGITYDVDFVLEKEKGWTALFECAKYGKYKAFRRLVQFGFDPYKTDCDWNTPYDIAVKWQQKQCAESILTHYMFHFNEINEVLYNVVGNAYPNSTETLRKAIREKQMVTFDEIAREIKFSAIEYPLSYRSNWRNRKEMNNTALHVAAMAKDYEKMSILIEAGFSARHCENDKGKTPFDYFKFGGNVGWLELYERICEEAKLQQCSVEDYMSKKVIEAKSNASVDTMNNVLAEAIKSKLYDFSSCYKAILEDAIRFAKKHVKIQANFVRKIIKSKNMTGRSRRLDALQQTLGSCNEYICKNNRIVGTELSLTFDKANRQLKKWQTSVDSMTVRLDREFRSKDLMKLKVIMDEAKKLPVISDEFAKLLIDKGNKMRKIEMELHQTLILAGVPEDFVNVYIRRLCSDIDELHNVRWLEIKRVGLDNKEQCKIIVRNLQKRKGFDLIDDSKSEMKKFLNQCNLSHHLEVLSFAGFIDVEDLVDEDDLAIFDDIMTGEELHRLESSLKRFAKRYFVPTTKTPR